MESTADGKNIRRADGLHCALVEMLLSSASPCFRLASKLASPQKPFFALSFLSSSQKLPVVGTSRLLSVVCCPVYLELECLKDVGSLVSAILWRQDAFSIAD